jgi:uncharacterized membrane protein
VTGHFRRALAICALTCAGALAAPVVVSEIPYHKESETKDWSAYGQTMLLDNGVRVFGLHRQVQTWPATKRNLHYVGWQLPDEANWYHSGMFDIVLNGRSVNVDNSQMTILESGARGVVDFTQGNQFGKFRCRFMVIPDSEVLFAEWALEPAAEVKSLQLQLHNYPGGYAATAEGKRQRQVICPEGTFETREQPYPFDPAKNDWFFLQDGLFDIDHKELSEKSYGPSGLVLPTGEAQSVQFLITGYEVQPEITYAPDRRRFRLAFFDYYKLGNKAAFQRFEREHDPVRKALEELDFVPTRLREAQRASISATGLPADADRWVGELKGLLAELPGGDWQQRPVTTEARAMGLLDRYDKARWPEVKQKRPGVALLEIRGLHWNYWGLDAAAAALGPQLRARQVSHYSEYYWKGEDLTSFPASWPDFAQYDVIVFANVPFTVLGPERAQALAEYIKAGGAVLLLGGTHAFGQAGLNAEPLGPLMPVKATHVFDLQQFPSYQPLRVASGAPAFLGRTSGPLPFDWSTKPSVLWHHQIETAPGARVWLQAGGAPFLVTGHAGAGRVAALCAPPYGPKTTGTLGFWEWPSWPALLARVLLWLGQGK